MSVDERRFAVQCLRDFGLSVNRACQLVDLQRATFLYQPKDTSDDTLLEELIGVAQENPRYGYRRAWALLRRKHLVNRKRVHRLWKQAHLQVKQRRRSTDRQQRFHQLTATYPNHIWAYDFVQDRDYADNPLYILTVIDEFTREGLAIDVEYTTSSHQVIDVLARLVGVCGVPAYVRSDNGAEFAAYGVQRWLAEQHIQPLYIEPGKPWQNGKDERFNGTIRDECLNLYVFASLGEARARLEAFLKHYNNVRPHSRLGYRTPVEFKQAWSEAQEKQQDSLIPT